MHAFPFYKKVYQFWKADQFITFVIDFFNYFQLQTYAPSINYGTYIISVYLMNFLVLLVILDILYVSYSFSQKRFSATWPLEILRSVASLLVTVFFLPITEVLLIIF